MIKCRPASSLRRSTARILFFGIVWSTCVSGFLALVLLLLKDQGASEVHIL